MNPGTAEFLIILPENAKAATKKNRLFSLLEVMCFELCF